MGYYLTSPAGLGGLLPDAEQQAASRAIASTVTGKSSGKAFETAVKAADFGLTQVGLAAEYLGQTAAGKVVKSSGAAGALAYSIVNKAQQGKYKADASGVIDVAADVQGFLGAVANIAAAAGGSKVAQEIASWSGVATACIIGVTAAATSTGVGAVAGGVACAFAILGKALDIAFGNAAERLPADKPRSIFCMYGENKKLIAADALRLAKVLRHYYGVKSFASLHRALDLDRFQWINETAYPDRPPTNSEGALQSPEKPIPAHNLATILQMLDHGLSGRDKHQSNINVRDGFALLAAYRTKVEREGRGLYQRFNDDHDINEQTIASAAFLGRTAVGTYGHARVKANITTGGNTFTWPGSDGVITPDLLPFVVVDELINFFAAVTSVEYQQYGSAYVGDYRIGSMNPVRFATVRDLDTSGEMDAPGAVYSSKCYTNLLRTEPCHMMDSYARSGGVNALREYGALRLMSAFSYLHMMWQWSSDDSDLRKDPFALAEATDEINAPIDPRQVVKTAAGYALRSDDGVAPDAPTTSVARFVGGAGLRTPYIYINANLIEVHPYTGGAFAASLPDPGPGKHRESRVGVVRLRNAILDHNKLVEAAIQSAVSTPAAVQYTDAAVAAMQSQLAAQAAQAAAAGLSPAMLEALRSSRIAQKDIANLPAAQQAQLTNMASQFQLAQQWAEARQAAASGQSSGGGVLLIGAAALAALLFIK